MATVTHLGLGSSCPLFPPLSPQEEAEGAFVEVPLEWAVAYFWRVKKFMLTSSLSWSIDAYAGNGPNPVPSSSGSGSANRNFIAGADNETALVCQRVFAPGDIFNSYSFGVGGDNTTYTAWRVDAGLQAVGILVFRSKDNKIYVAVFGSAGGVSAVSRVSGDPTFCCYPDDPRAAIFWHKDTYISFSNTPPPDGTIEAGPDLVWTIGGLNVMIPTYKISVSENGAAGGITLNYDLKAEATEYWPYDPGDGGGPIYNTSTGLRIRDLP